MTEAIIEAELVAACSSLGYSDGQKYVRDPDCIETIRDLLRYLRRDDDTHQIRLALGQTSVVQTDLIPLLREHSKDRVLLDLVLRLLVNLTSPALLVFNQEVPEDKAAHQQYLKLVAQQQAFKEAFTEGGVWASVAAVLGDGLQQEGGRDDDTNLVVEMCLVLLRNVLAVAPGRQDSIRTNDDADLHDQVLWSLHLAGVPDLLLYLSTCQNEQELSLHSLEIISLMLRQQDAQNLANSALHRSKEEKKKDDDELLRIRESEKARRQQQVKKHYNARHSRFGGTFYVQNMKSISDRDLISHRPVADVSSINFDRNKMGKKIPKNRAPLPDTHCTRRSTLAIRLFLQEFCVEFLNGAYNNIMYIVKDNLNRARTQEHDESYYLWAIKFFMEFNRHHEFKVELVSETLSIGTVHYVQTNIENYYEMMTTEKKKIPLWSRRMHNGLRAYQEILLTLSAMDRSPDASVRSSSLTLKNKIFYVVEYRELPLILLQNFDQIKMSRLYLKDLIEMTHIFLKLLESMCKKTKYFMVQQSGKKKAAKKKKKKLSNKSESLLSVEKLEEIWSSMAEELSAIIGDGGELPTVIPFDPLSESTEEEQKETAMRKVNALLRKKELPEAVSLFRASREVWPEGDIFGSQNIEPSEEFSCLRDVFMADLNPVEEQAPEPEESDQEEDEESALAEELQDESTTHISEKELNFDSFVRRFAHTKIMQAYGILLKSYGTNSAHTNRCIIKLFHRLAWDSKMPAIFFQSSLFITFHEAMTDPARKANEIIGEIVKFAKYIVRQFFKVAETNPKVFMEILFWKNSKEAVDIECGYDVPQTTKSAQAIWSEEEDDEIMRLYEEFKNKEMNPDEDKDVVDLILANLIREDRTRRVVLKKLKDLGLITGVQDIRKKSVKVRGKQWTEVEEEELRVLFEEHKDAIDPLTRIMDFMVNPRPKNKIVNKLLELGIINDKSEVKKKRIPKAKSKSSKTTMNNSTRWDSPDESNNEDEIVSDDSEDETEKRAIAKSQPMVSVVTPHLVSAALKSVKEKNMQESIQWLIDTMTEVADDREEDGDFEPIPILSFTDFQSKALEDESFQSLMKVIGLSPPQSHEEMFWRVPSKLTIEGLRKRTQYLKLGLEGNLPSPIANETTTVNRELLPSAGNISSEVENRKSLKSALSESNINSLLTNSSLPQESNINEETDEEPRGNPQFDSSDSDEEPLGRIRKSQLSDESDKENKNSDSSDGSPLSVHKKRSLSLTDGTISPVRSTKKRRIIVDDSGDENEDMPDPNQLDLHLETESMEVEQYSKNRIDDSDGEEDNMPCKGSPSLADSDRPVVQSRVRAIIDSDDEDI